MDRLTTRVRFDFVPDLGKLLSGFVVPLAAATAGVFEEALLFAGGVVVEAAVAVVSGIPGLSINKL